MAKVILLTDEGVCFHEHAIHNRVVLPNARITQRTIQQISRSHFTSPYLIFDTRMQEGRVSTACLPKLPFMEVLEGRILIVWINCTLFEHALTATTI